MGKEKHLFDEIAQLIREVQQKCPAVKEYTLESHPKELLSEALEVKKAVEKKIGRI